MASQPMPRTESGSHGALILALTFGVLLVALPFAVIGRFSGSFLPHSYCYLFDKRLIALNVVTDGLIWLSYLAIAGSLYYLTVRGRKEIPFHWMFLSFGVFIVACGFTHFMEMLTLWKPVYWASGYVKGVTAVASVVTASALPFAIPGVLRLAASRHYQSLFEANPNPMWVLDPQTLKFLAVNGATVETFGYGRRQMLGMTLEDLRPPEQSSALHHAMLQTRLAEAADLAPARLSLQTKEGRVLRVEMTSHRLRFRDQDALLGVVIETTERDRADELMRKSEARYRSLVLATTQIVWNADREGKLSGVQESWCEFTGQTTEEVAERGLIAAVHPEDAPRVAATWRDAVVERRVFESEYRLRRHDGIYRRILARAAPVISSKGELVEWIGCCTDLGPAKP